jgi:hypothetical protein
VAGTLLRLGLLGRATDEHPVCRACAFDLFNLPADHTACPECGSDLRAPRAVRVGNRTRRPAPLYAGLALLLLSTLAACLVATIVARGIDTYRWLPDAWVERDTRSTLRSQQTRAWAELKRRFFDNGLSAKRTARLVDLALARQADTKAAWITDVGDFLEAVHKAKALPHDQWVQYATGAVQLGLRARPRVGRGDPIVPEVFEHGDRVAADSVLLARLVDVTPRGDLVYGSHTQSVENMCEQIGTGSWRYQVDVAENRPAMANAPAGKHAVEVAATVEVLEGSEMDPTNAKPLLRKHVRLNADFDLVERDAVSIEIVPDHPALHARMEAAVKVHAAEAVGDSGVLFVRYSVTGLPVSIASAVTVRQDNCEWKGKLACEATVSNSGGFFVPAGDFPGDRLDVIFEPDVNVALDTVDATQMWNGRLEFRDVPVLRKPAATTRP